MISKSKSLSGGPSSLSGPKKKKAPPRPPPPNSIGGIQTSQSFRTADELDGKKRSGFSQQRPSLSVDYTRTRSGAGGGNLIDLATPPGSPDGVRKFLNKPTGPPDYKYRVGASIFYIKSALENSTSQSPVANPFSPPRPSAQSLLSNAVKPYQVPPPLFQDSTERQNTLIGASKPSSQPTTTGANIKYVPTIIKRANENNNIIKSTPGNGNTGSFRSSSGSSDWSDYSHQSQPQPRQQHQQPRYGNVAMPTWDEPPAQHPLKTSVVMPTIIKPPTAKKPSLMPKPSVSLMKPSASTVTALTADIPNPDLFQHRTSYYDEPPDSDFDEEDDPDDGIVSPPMPTVPPPPPPSDLTVDEWVDSTKDAPAYHEPTYGNQGTESDRAYAITLYDYFPDAVGDLPLQAGDLVYLTKKIDDAWLYGTCAGYEGMFPSNYVNVVVPLPEDNSSGQQEVQVEETKYHYTDVLYQFDAETENDLNLKVGDVVTIYGRLDEDWLYGGINGSVGQFPAAFVSTVPSDLPTIPA